MALDTTPELAWHFVGTSLLDGRPVPPDGEWLRHDGKLVICKAGLHASTRIIDALGYAPGSTICRVAVRGIGKRDTDKLVASERVILWRVENSDDLLRAFARKCALSVDPMWDGPGIVRRYLGISDESIPSAAWDAARDAAWDAALATAGAAAWAAARAAAGDAARATAGAAAGDAAWDAAIERFDADLEAMVTEAAGHPDTDALLRAAA